MIEFPDYERATNAAYCVLRNYSYKFPEVDIGYILSTRPNIKIRTYSDAAKKLGVSHNEFTYYFASSEHGFTVADYDNDRFIIYYNDWKDEKTIRFTLAHELGHTTLNHKEDNAVSDKEANCFARNLLCPIQLVNGFKLSSPKEYEECFGVSAPMAKAAFSHRSADLHYISRELYNEIDNNIHRYMTGYSLSEIYGVPI